MRRNKVMGAVKAALFKRSRRLSSVELGFAQEVLVWQGVLGRLSSGEFWRFLFRSGMAVSAGLAGFGQVRYGQSWRSGFGMFWCCPVSRGKFRRSSRGLAR